MLHLIVVLTADLARIVLMSKLNLAPYDLLVQEIYINLLPRFLDLGFIIVPLSLEDKKTEMKYREPFGSLKRHKDYGVDLIDIVFYKDKTPKFLIDFGVAPIEGVVLPWGQKLFMEEIHTSALPVSYQLSASTFRKKPFSFPLLKKPTTETARIVICKVIDGMGQIEDWFESGRIGKQVFKNVNYIR